METIRVKKEKESKFKSTLRWNDKNKQTVLKTTIPAKVIDNLQLTAGDEIIYNIKETSLNVFQCEISFKADHIEHIDKSPRESASTTDEPMTKKVEIKNNLNKKTSNAGNTIDVKHFADIPIQDGKYTIKVTSPSRPKLRIVGATIKDEVNTKEIGIEVTNKSEDEVQAIIDKILSCKDADAKKLKTIVNSFKSEQYRT